VKCSRLQGVLNFRKQSSHLMHLFALFFLLVSAFHHSPIVHFLECVLCESLHVNALLCSSLPFFSYLPPFRVLLQ
jgi:hypothetical protein